MRNKTVSVVIVILLCGIGYAAWNPYVNFKDTDPTDTTWLAIEREDGLNHFRVKGGHNTLGACPDPGTIEVKIRVESCSGSVLAQEDDLAPGEWLELLPPNHVMPAEFKVDITTYCVTDGVRAFLGQEHYSNCPPQVD